MTDEELVEKVIYLFDDSRKRFSAKLIIALVQEAEREREKNAADKRQIETQDQDRDQATHRPPPWEMSRI